MDCCFDMVTVHPHFSTLTLKPPCLPEKVKGLAWAEARYQSEWDVSSALGIYFFLGKSRNRYSFTCNLAQYQDIYNRLTGLNRRIHSMDDLLDLALEEWQQQVDLPSS
jgi:hypothetical protein